MNLSQQLTSDTAPLETYQRYLWALTTAGIVAGFFFLAWLSIQRAEIIVTRRHVREAEQKADTFQRERNNELWAHTRRVKILNEKLAKAETARIAAENEARQTAANVVKLTASPKVEAAVEKRGSLQMAMAEPNAQELTAFIKEHLVRMTEPVEAQLSDYAGEVDFHDKAHASLAVIENERKQLMQKYPVRSILKDEIQPQLSAVHDATYGWIATAIFDWRWVYRSRSGALTHGATRDIWKIVPTAQGFKIVSEHSIDPVTGASKD